MPRCKHFDKAVKICRNDDFAVNFFGFAIRCGIVDRPQRIRRNRLHIRKAALISSQYYRLINIGKLIKFESENDSNYTKENIRQRGYLGGLINFLEYHFMLLY